MRLRKRRPSSEGQPPEQEPAYEEPYRAETMRPHIIVTEEVVVTYETVQGDGIATGYEGAVLGSHRTLASNSENAQNLGADPLVYTEGGRVVVAEGDHIINANGGHMVITGGNHRENAEGGDEAEFNRRVDLQ